MYAQRNFCLIDSHQKFDTFMPCPSAWTKHFFVQDKIRFDLDKIILSRTKYQNFVHGLKIIFPLRNLISSHGQSFCPGQNYFVLDKSDFVLDKKYFVWADGQGIRVSTDGHEIMTLTFCAVAASRVVISKHSIIQIENL